MPTIVTERVFDEINSIVVSAIGLSSTAIVTKTTKFVRFDWRQMIELFEQSVSGGMEPPWCIIRPGVDEPAEWDMASISVVRPVEIFLIESERNRIKTTITSANVIAGTTLTVASTTKMFIGQRLYLKTTDVYVYVQSITDATHVVITVATVAVNGEELVSDLSSDVEVKIEKLRFAFKPGGSYTNFQILADPVCDISDMNPVNEAHEHSQYYLFAGSCYIELLTGYVNN